MSGLRRILAAVTGTPWAILPERLEAMLGVLEFQAAGGTLTAAEIQARIGDRKAAPPSASGIAVLPLYGIVGHRMNQVQDVSGPGGTSTEQFGQWLDAALNDPAVGSIILDVDSPGGAVTGVPELAAKIFAARGTKPIVAIANSMAASAAYWIAAAADEFWVTPSGDVGSIGVYAVHLDRTAANEQMGLKPTYISAGKYKVEMTPDAPLSDDARAAIQERVDETYRDFIAAVSKYRNVDRKAVADGYGEGRVLHAKPALKAGMVDRVGSFDDLVRSLSSKSTRPRPALAASVAMPTTTAANGTAAVIELVAAVPSTGTLAAGQGAVPAPAVVPTPSAASVEAKELSMSDQDKSATAVAGAPDEGASNSKKELARRDGLAALAAEHDLPIARVQTWVQSGASVEDAQREVLADLRKKAATQPIARVHAGGDQGTEAGPFRNLGEQLHAVVAAASGRVDERLYKVQELAGPTGAGAGLGSDGGFLIQKDFASDLMKEGTGAGTLASRCSQTEIGADADGLEVVYIDETSRATGSRWGGVQVYRRDEADTVSATKPKLDKWECRLEDLMGLAYVTDRLMRDAGALGSVFSEAFRDEFAFKIDDEIIRGNGAAQCWGVLNHAATVTQTKESGQTADTIVAENVIKMWSRVHPRSKVRGAWFVNTETSPQLLQMSVKVKDVAGTENVGGQLIYMPPGGLSGAPFGSLFGRPVIEIEQASALGDVGDISFLDLSQYKLITKGGISEDESIHVRFIYGEKTLRWMAAINGQPKAKAPLTPYKGTATLSSFVTLQAR